MLNSNTQSISLEEYGDLLLQDSRARNPKLLNSLVDNFLKSSYKLEDIGDFDECHYHLYNDICELIVEATAENMITINDILRHTEL